MEQDLSEILSPKEQVEFSIEYKGKVYEFAYRVPGWLKKNRLISKAIRFTRSGEMTADLDIYYRLFLEECLVQAPWPLSKTKFILAELGDEFGKKLQQYIPTAFELEEDEDTKKVSEE